MNLKKKLQKIAYQQPNKILFSLFFLLLISLFSPLSFAQNAPKYSNEFLAIGSGARGLAMGNAQTAIVNDATAGYWNPAGLLQIKKRYEIALMHSEQYGGVAKYDFASFATPVDSNSHIGLSVIRFGVDDIPDTRFLYDANGNINYNNVKFFSSADYAFLVSYARKITQIKGLSAGTNFKVIYRNAGNFANAFGFGLDAGLQYERKSWKFGLMLKDITGTFNSWTHNSSLIYDVYTQTGNVIPKNTLEITLPRAILGVGKYWVFNKTWDLLATADFVNTFDGNRNTIISGNPVSLDPVMGMELGYDKLVYVRSGLNNAQRIKNFDGSTSTQAQINFGIGIKIKNFTIDYALTRNQTDKTTSALYSNIFSVKISFDGEKRQDLEE